MNLLLRGDARSIPLADESVHCVVTSPPYYSLRDYGTARWEGGDAGCDHVEKQSARRDSPGGYLSRGSCLPGGKFAGGGLTPRGKVARNRLTDRASRQTTTRTGRGSGGDMAGSNRGRDVPARTGQDRWPQPRPALPTPQACPGVPAGVAVYALCRDPETLALFLVAVPALRSWPDIDRRRRGALLPGLRWDQHRRRTQLARGAESTHPEPGRAGAERDRPWRAGPAAHQRRPDRAWRADEVRPSQENHATPAPDRRGRSSAIVSLIIILAAWLAMTALAYYTYTAKSPGWGMIPRRAGQDGLSDTVQITGKRFILKPGMSGSGPQWVGLGIPERAFHQTGATAVTGGKITGKLRRPPDSLGCLESASAKERDEPTIEPGRLQHCAGQCVSLVAGKITGDAYPTGGVISPGLKAISTSEASPPITGNIAMWLPGHRARLTTCDPAGSTRKALFVGAA
jgi:hypothetical protein